MVIKILFFVFVFLIVYHYILFPIIVFLLNFLKRDRKDSDLKYTPKITVLLITKNSSGYIKERTANILRSDYPEKLIEIIVLVDKGLDNTEQIVKEIQGIRYFISENKVGKAALINKGIEMASNDIIGFTDDNTEFNKETISELVKPFYYQDVAGVCGKLKIKGASFTEKLYWNIETFYKSVQGKFGLVIGANGGNYAIRKKCLEKLPEDKLIMDDFINTLNVLKTKDKFVFAGKSIAYENYDKAVVNDLSRKKRIGIGDGNALFYIKELFKKRKNLLLYFFTFSQKILRWFMAPVQILFLISNMLLPIKGFDFFNIIFLIQFIFYLTGIALYKLKKSSAVIFLGNFALFYGIISPKKEKEIPYWE